MPRVIAIKVVKKFYLTQKNDFSGALFFTLWNLKILLYTFFTE